jgi:hypothetical protein
LNILAEHRESPVVYWQCTLAAVLCRFGQRGYPLRERQGPACKNPSSRVRAFVVQNLLGLFTTENKSLAQRIGEEGRSVIKMADGYSEEHEERLIDGICIPEHSPIYLSIMGSLKGVTVHTLAVSGKIVSLSSKS